MSLPWFPLHAKQVQDGRLRKSEVLCLWAVGYLEKALPGKPVGCPGIARQAGCATSTAQLALGRLVELGLVRKSSRGNGLAAHYTTAPQDTYRCPAEFSRTCPNSGRCLPASGEVGCRLVGRYLQLTGQVGGGDHKREVEQEREREVLSPDSLRFREEIQRRSGRRLSDKQLREIEPCFRAGIPLGFVLLQSESGSWGESPWDFAGRVYREWQQLVADARVLGQARTQGIPHGLPAERVERVRRHGSAEHRAWAFGGENEG